MPSAEKNLVLIEQGGCGEINSQTPKHIRGLATTGLGSGVGLLLIREDAIKIFHIDIRTSVESIKQQIDNFSYSKYKIFCNKDVSTSMKCMEVTNSIIGNVCEALGIGRLLPDDSSLSGLTGENFLVEMEGDDVVIHNDKGCEYLRERSINNKDFDEYKKTIRHISRSFFGNQAVEVDFDGKSIKAVNKLDRSLESDIEYISHLSPQKRSLFLKSQVLESKYNGLAFCKDSADPWYEHIMFKYLEFCIARYFELKEKCKLSRYKIPFIYNDEIRRLSQESSLQEISQEFGENANLKTCRESDWSLSYEVSLPYDFLKQDIRKELGLDRKSIVNLGRRQSDFLEGSIDGVAIEPHKEKPDRILVTFPAGEDFVRIIESVSSVENLKKTLAQEEGPSSIVEETSATGSAVSPERSC